MRSEVPSPCQVPNPVIRLISCPHSPLLMPSASVPSFSMTVQFQFAGFSQGCRSVHLGICFSKNILPFVFILYIGVWDPAAKKHWETTCLGHFCSVHCLQGWPRGAAAECSWGCREMGPGPAACPVALALLGIGVIPVLGGGPHHSFSFIPAFRGTQSVR